MNKFFNRLINDLPVLGGDSEVILVRKTRKAEFSFALFLVPVVISSRSKPKRNKDNLPYAAVFEVIKRRKHNVGVVQEGKGSRGLWGLICGESEKWRMRYG